MKLLSLLCAVGATVLLLSLSCPQAARADSPAQVATDSPTTSANHPDPEPGYKSLDLQFMNALCKTNVSAVMRVFAASPNLVVVFPDGTQVRGAENVRAAFTAFFGQYNHVRGQYSETDAVDTGSTVIGFGKGYLYLTSKNDIHPQRLDFRYTDCREKVNGTWVISVETLTAVAYQPLPTDTLYSRIGGYDVIAALVDDYMARIYNDAPLREKVQTISNSDRQRLRQILVDLISSTAKGPVTFIDDDQQAILSPRLAADDWDHVISLFSESLDSFHVPQKEKTDMEQLMITVKPQIMAM